MVQAWLDNTGLYRKYGPDKAAPTIGGEVLSFGELREVVFTLDLTTVGSSATILSDVQVIPEGVRIEEIEVVTHTAADSAGDAGVLNLGLIATDRSTEIDFNGFIAAAAQTTMDAAGETTVYQIGTTGVGALVGTTTTATGHITADYDTAAFSAGVLHIRIRYYKP